MFNEQNTEDFLKEAGILGDESTGGGAPGGTGGQESPTPIDTPTFFGEEFTDWDQVRTAVPERLKKYGELERELSELRSKPLAEFADPEIAEYNSFVKNTGNKDWSSFQKVKSIDNLEGIDALVFKTVFDNPELSGKENEVREQLLASYKIDPQLFDSNSVEFTLNKKKMESEAQQAKNWFSELKGKVRVDAPSLEDITAKKEAAKAEWRKVVEKALAQVDKLPIPIFDEKENQVKMLGEFELKDTHRNPFINPMVDAFSGLSLNDDSSKMVSAEYTDRVIARNLPYIIKHAVGIVEAQIRQELETKYGGGMAPKSPGGAGGAGLDALEEYLNK